MNAAPSVLITGASRGIGRATADTFAAAGYRLYLNCLHRGAALEEYARALSARYGVPCRTFVCDVGSYAAVRDMFAQIPSLDLLINNAGVAHYGLFTELSPETWRTVLRTNLDAAYHTCACAVPLFLRNRGDASGTPSAQARASAGVSETPGRILNISSVWGEAGAACEVAYSASKGGLNAFTRALAKELAPSRIPVNAIACGVIDTEMNRAHFNAAELEALRSEIPADRFGTPEEVAQLALLLAKAPSYVTGQIVGMDGGWM